MKIEPKHLVGIAIFLLSFAILLMTIHDFGLTWDEPYYIAHSNKLQHWFGLLIDNNSPFSDDAVNNFVQFDRYHNCHPPFYKLSGLFFKQIIGQFLYSNLLYQYRVSTAFWSALLIALIFLYLYRAYQSYLIAILGAGIFFTIPRFFGHMHLFTTDAIIVSLYFLALYLFVFGKNTVSAIFGGLFGGALLASKFTGVLLFPILLIAAPCFSDRTEYAKRIAYFIPAAVLAFLVFDIHLWVGFWQELFFYFESVLDRESVVPISTLFFGKVYSYRLPWYQPLVMLGICIPLSLIVFAVLSPLAGRFRRDRQYWLFEIFPFIFLLIVFLLPQAPKHDGIRLFSLAWPYLILLSIRGVYGISHSLIRLASNRLTEFGGRTAVKMRWMLINAILILALLLNVQALVKYHPYQLSYYNAMIGGAAGAAEKGFTISYWYEALNQPFLDKLNALAKNDSILIYSFPHTDILKYNKALGLFDSRIKIVADPQRADFLLVLNRIIGPQLSNYLIDKETAITASTPDNVWVLSLFANNQ
jgi:4-amino-4-deoxy-L-arabinose transferase-like glycosyltransferase